MKTKWTKKPPKENGWYWVKFKGRSGKTFCDSIYYRVNVPYIGRRRDLQFGDKIK